MGTPTADALRKQGFALIGLGLSILTAVLAWWHLWAGAVSPSVTGRTATGLRLSQPTGCRCPSRRRRGNDSPRT